MSGAEPVSLAVEGDSDEAVLRRVLADHGFSVVAVYGRTGKNGLDLKLAAYDNAARHSRWLVVRDLDHDAECAPTLVRKLFPRSRPHMRFRVAVRAMEAWLLADAEGLARFLGVSRHHVPSDPERLPDPKRDLVALAGRSRSRAMREDMVPEPGTTARVGPGYVSRIGELARDAWSWRRASDRSDSLRRCIASLRGW